MKKLIPIIALAFLCSCEKEPVDPDPVVPVTPANHFIIDGVTHGVNSDDTAVFFASDGRTIIAVNSGAVYMTLTFPGNDTGTFVVQNDNATQYYNSVTVSSTENYRAVSSAVHVTEYGPVGGTVAGTFSGSFKKTQDTTIVVNVSGAFRCTRIPDM